MAEIVDIEEIPVLRVSQNDVPLVFLERMRPAPVVEGETLTIEVSYNVAYVGADGIRGNIVGTRVR